MTNIKTTLNGVEIDELPADDGRGPWLMTNGGVPFTTATPQEVQQALDDLHDKHGWPHEPYYNSFGTTSTRPDLHVLSAQEHIAEALKLIFPASSWDDNVEETARRVLGYWSEFVPKEEIDFNFTTFKAAPSQIILIGDITFTSICAHHLLPFQGKLHIGYKAHDIQAGLSKIPRLVEFHARRPQVQENLTAGLMKDLTKRLQTKDVMVVCEAQHTCVSARGARLHNGVMRTSLASGLFLSSPPARQEFFDLLARNGV